MKVLIGTLIKRVFTALLGKKMFFWGAEFLAGLTDNMVDDNFVLMAKAADENNPEDIIKYAQQAIEEAMKMLQDKTPD